MAKAFPIYSYRPYVLHLPVPKGTVLSINPQQTKKRWKTYSVLFHRIVPSDDRPAASMLRRVMRALL